MIGQARYLSAAETAKLVRAAVKAAFPGVKFSVRSETYAGGASINVYWTDGPFTHEVDPLVRRYARSDFDGQTDSTTYRPAALVAFDAGLPELVRFGADFVFTNRAVSPEYLANLDLVAATLTPTVKGWVDVSTPWGHFDHDRDLLPYFLSEYLTPPVAARLAALPADERLELVAAL